MIQRITLFRSRDVIQQLAQHCEKPTILQNPTQVRSQSAATYFVLFASKILNSSNMSTSFDLDQTSEMELDPATVSLKIYRTSICSMLKQYISVYLVLFLSIKNKFTCSFAKIQNIFSSFLNKNFTLALSLSDEIINVYLYQK